MLLHCVNQFALNTFRLQRAPTVPSFQKKQRRPKHDDNIKSYRISPKRLLAPSPSSSCTKLESKATTNCNNHAECQYFECIALRVSSLYAVVQQMFKCRPQRHRWQCCRQCRWQCRRQCHRQYRHQYQRGVSPATYVGANDIQPTTWNHLPQIPSVASTDTAHIALRVWPLNGRSTGNNGTTLARWSMGKQRVCGERNQTVDNFQIGWFSTQIPSKNAVKGKFNSSWLFQDKRVNILWNRFLALKTPYLPVWQMFHNSFCPEKARKMAWIDVPFAQRFVRIRIIFDISKVPFSSPKYKYNISLNFFRTKGDYKSNFSR